MKGLASHFARVDSEYEEKCEADDNDECLREDIKDDICQSLRHDECQTDEFDIDLTEVWAEIERLIEKKMEELKNER